MKRWDRRERLDDRLLRLLAKNDRARANHSVADDEYGDSSTTLGAHYFPVLRPLRTDAGRGKITVSR